MRFLTSSFERFGDNRLTVSIEKKKVSVMSQFDKPSTTSFKTSCLCCVRFSISDGVILRSFMVSDASGLM